MRHVFKWNGAPLAFIHGSALFDFEGRYLGWVGRDGRVWRDDGRYIGELVEDEYVLRNTLRSDPPRMVPRVPPVPPIAPLMPAWRIPRPALPDWVDPFDQYVGRS